MEEFSEELTSSYDKLVEKLSGWMETIILELPNLVIAIVVGVVAYFLSKYIRKFSVKATSKFTKNKTILNLASNITAVVFSILVLFTILSIFDLSSTINKLLATAGVVGLAIGLALQDPMNNLFSGVFMSVRELYKIGDLVESNDYFGTIRNIDLRATTILLPTGQEVVIPNKEVIQNPLTNFSVTGMRRVDISCGVSYGDDLDKVEEIAVKAIEDNLTLMKGKPVDVVYNEFGDSSINFILRFWIDNINQRDYLIEQSKAIKALKQAFDANDIMIPFPIRTLDFGIRGGVALDKVMPQREGLNSNNTNSSEKHELASSTN